MSTRHNENEEDFSLKKLFVPFTTLKAIHWIILIGLLVYANMVFNGFVADDGLQIRQNSSLDSLLNIPHFFLGNFLDSGMSSPFQNIYYKPVMFTFYTLINTIFGKTPFFFHILQLLLHITNSILVFLLFKNFLNKYLSFFLALIFLVHPINQETVAYIADLQDALFFLFGLSSLLVILKEKYSLKSIVIISLLLLLSLLSKETGILFVIVLLLSLFLYRRQYIKRYSIAAASVCSIYIVLRFMAIGIHSSKANEFPIMQLSLFERLLNIPKIITYYVSTFFYPKDLAITQNWVVTRINVTDFYLPLLFIIVLLSVFIFFILRFKKTNTSFKEIVFFGIWFLIGLLLHLQIIPLDQTVADRWFYFPIVGLLGLFGVLSGMLKINVNKSTQSITFVLIAIIIISILSLRTIIRNSDWKDAITLYSHDLTVKKDNFALENSLGYELYTAGRLDDALYHLKKSNNLMPDNVLNIYNLGVVYSMKWQKDRNENNFKQAEQYYIAAIKSNQLSWSYENLALLYYFNKQFQEAKQTSEKGLELYPNNSYLWFLISKIEYELDNNKTAIRAANNAYLIEPSSDKKKWILFLSNK